MSHFEQLKPGSRWQAMGRQQAVGTKFLQPTAYSLFLKFTSGIILSNLNRCIMSHFEELNVWKRTVDLAVRVYDITKKDPFNKDYGLRDQMRRASVSISSNIAEGDELDSDKSSIRHFRIAKGSSAELFTQSIISFRIGYLHNDDFSYIQKECQEIMAMLAGLIKHRNKAT